MSTQTFNEIPTGTVVTLPQSCTLVLRGGKNPPVALAGRSGVLLENCPNARAYKISFVVSGRRRVTYVGAEDMPARSYCLGCGTELHGADDHATGHCGECRNVE